MRTGWRTALVVVLGVAAAPSARPVSVHAQAAPVVASQEVNQTVDVAEAPVPPRVRGFNTAQLVEWVNEDGTPQQSKPDLHQKIWITEWGFPSRPYTRGKQTCRYSAADQARLIKLEHEYLARLPYTAFSGYFNLVDDTSTGQNGPIGLVCLDFTLKRSFNTWRQLRPAAPGGPLTTGVCPRPSPPPPTL
jgi:hypothetical protein